MGNSRSTFNSHLSKIPGVYNINGKFDIAATTLEAYDMFNLPLSSKVNDLQRQFDEIELLFK